MILLFDSDDVTVYFDDGWFIVKKYKGKELTHKCRFDTQNDAFEYAQSLI